MKITVFIINTLLLSAISIYAQTWEFVGLDSLAIYHLHVSGDTIYAGTIDRNNNPNIISGLYVTYNAGNNWLQLDSTLGDGYINGLHVISPERLFILKSGIIYKTINHGETWEALNNISNYSIRWFGVSPFNMNEIYYIVLGWVPGGTFNNLYKSSDGGGNWQELGPFPSSSHGNELSFSFDLTDSMNLYVSVDNHFLNRYFFKSTDKGNNWFNVSSPPVLPTDIYTDYMISNKIYLFRGPYISNDGGLSWLEADAGLNNNHYDLSFYQDKMTTKMLYDLRTDGLYVSRSDSIFWEKVEGSEDLPLDFPASTRNLKNIVIDEETYKIYLGTSDGLFRKDILTNISNENETLVNRFELEQNFPNPFNPITTISYQIPKASSVTIIVYDVLGKEIAVLINEEKSPGSYEVRYEATGLPSGTYYYRLNAGSFVETRKMLLLR